MPSEGRNSLKKEKLSTKGSNASKTVGTIDTVVFARLKSTFSFDKVLGKTRKMDVRDEVAVYRPSGRLQMAVALKGASASRAVWR